MAVVDFELLDTPDVDPSPTEGELIYGSDDYDEGVRKGAREFATITLRANTDGSLDLHTFFQPLRTKGGDLVPEPDRHYSRFTPFLSLLGTESEEISQFALDPTTVKASAAMGYRIETSRAADSRAIEVHLPSTPRINLALDYMRDQTGFAPKLEDHDGNVFTYAEMQAAHRRGAVLVSSDIEIDKPNALIPRVHDLLIHTLPVALFSKWSFAAMVKREKVLEDKVTDPNSSRIEQLNAEHAYIAYMRSLDGAIDTYMFAHALTGINHPDAFDPETGEHDPYAYNREQFSGLMFNVDKGSRIQQIAAFLASVEATKRLKILADMPPLGE